MKCIAVIITNLVETFCHEALVVGASWSRLNEALLRVPTIDGLVGRKNVYRRFLLYITEGSRRFECHMCVVVILDSSGRLTAWRSVFPSREHLRTKVTPDWHLSYSENGSDLCRCCLN